MLANSGQTTKGTDKLSEVIRDSLIEAKTTFPDVIDDILEAIDLIASKDEFAAERVRALFRDALFGPSSIGAPTPSSRSMKLAYIANSPMPSAAANCVHILKMCSALRRNGVDVTLFADGSLDVAPVAKASLFRDFDVSDPFNYVRVESGRGHTETNLKKVLAAAGSSSTHLITRSAKAAYFAALLGIDTLLELHAPPASMLPFVRELSRLSAFRGLIVITHALYNEIIGQIPELGDRVWVIPDAADPPKTDGRVFELRGKEKATLHVGYVGHLYPGKGLELIIEIAARIPTCAFHVLGGDPEDICRWKKRRTLPKNIVFYGHHPHAEVPAFLRAVDVTIAPFQWRVFARGNTLDIGRWMSPLKIFEYMANAKPIVTSDVPAMREVLVTGETAMLVDPDNIEAWVATLKSLGAESGVTGNSWTIGKESF